MRHAFCYITCCTETSNTVSQILKFKVFRHCRLAKVNHYLLSRADGEPTFFLDTDLAHFVQNTYEGAYLHLVASSLLFFLT